MANVNAPNGFTFVRRWNGSTKPPELVEFPLATTNEPLAKGDLVSLLAAGSVDRTCTDDANHDQTLCIGVCDSILYKNASGQLIDAAYVGAAQGDDTTTLGNGTGGIVRVMLLDNNVWSVQVVSTSAVSQTLIGNNADPVAAAATDPTQQGQGGHSAQTLDTPGTGAALFKIIGLHKRVGQVFSATLATSQYGRVLVVAKESFLAQVPTAAGI